MIPRPSPAALPAAREGISAWAKFLLLTFLFIFAGRAWMIERYAASTALVDEWDATGGELLARWHDGTLTLPALFEAHNGDHRIVATRLLEILCYSINGSWEPQWVMTVKAAIYAAAATLFIQLLAGGLATRRYLAAGVLGVLFAFPFNYQNLIWAFQSQFDFFLLAVAIGWLALLRGKYGGALVSAFLALFTLGAGPVLAASYVPWLAWRWYRDRPARRTRAIHLGLALAIVAIGLVLRSGAPPDEDTPRQRVATLASALAWPYGNLLAQATSDRTVRLVPAVIRNFPSAQESWLRGATTAIARHPSLLVALNGMLAAVILLPSAVLARWTVRHRSLPRAAIGPLVLTAFALLMSLATALARPNQTPIAVRYLDLVSLMGFSAIAAGFVLSQLQPPARRWLVFWAGAMLAGYVPIMGGTLAKLNQRMPAHWLANLQAYFPAHDHGLLADNHESRWPILESDSVSRFMALLDEPRMAAVLPRSLTAPEAPLAWPAALARTVRRAGGMIAALAALLMLGLGASRGEFASSKTD